MWLQQRSHRSVGFLVRITGLSEQNSVWRRKNVCRQQRGQHAEPDRRVKWHHAARVPHHKGNLSTRIEEQSIRDWRSEHGTRETARALRGKAPCRQWAPQRDRRDPACSVCITNVTTRPDARSQPQSCSDVGQPHTCPRSHSPRVSAVPQPQPRSWPRGQHRCSQKSRCGDSSPVLVPRRWEGARAAAPAAAAGVPGTGQPCPACPCSVPRSSAIAASAVKRPLWISLPHSPAVASERAQTDAIPFCVKPSLLALFSQVVVILRSGSSVPHPPALPLPALLSPSSAPAAHRRISQRTASSPPTRSPGQPAAGSTAPRDAA